MRSRTLACALLGLALAAALAPGESLRERARRDRLNRYLLPAMRKAGVDTWIVVTRENAPDPIGFDLAAHHAVGRAVCLFKDDGNRLLKIAICASFDTETIEKSLLYDRVVAYGKEGAAPHLQEELGKLAPRKIAVNSSKDESLADGLTSGNLEWLREMLGPDWGRLLVPAEPLIVAFRSRKTAEEIEHYRAAVRKTEQILAEALTSEHVVAGRTTERELATFITRRRAEMGLSSSWESEQDPNVMASLARGHSSPGETVIRPGSVIRVDMGVDDGGYKTDVQRMAYVLSPGEKEPPADIRRAFETALAANRAAIAALRAGVTGLLVDTAARDLVRGAGYPEFDHATGHPIGFFTHDIGPILGPDWPDRYGKKVKRTVETQMVFAVEPSVTTRIASAGGPVGFALEENVVVTDKGAEYLGTPQTALILIPSATAK